MESRSLKPQFAFSYEETIRCLYWIGPGNNELAILEATIGKFGAVEENAPPFEGFSVDLIPYHGHTPK